jgi:hypothetical protein
MNTYIVSLLLSYTSFTGQPSYTLITDNWLSQHNLGHRWQQHQIQYGDLNLDGQVDQADSDLYNSLMPPFGWSISTTSKVHWYRDCQYIKGKTVTPCLIDNRTCLTCVARKSKMEN